MASSRRTARRAVRSATAPWCGTRPPQARNANARSAWPSCARVRSTPQVSGHSRSRSRRRCSSTGVFEDARAPRSHEPATTTAASRSRARSSAATNSRWNPSTTSIQALRAAGRGSGSGGRSIRRRTISRATSAMVHDCGPRSATRRSAAPLMSRRSNNALRPIILEYMLYIIDARPGDVRCCAAGTGGSIFEPQARPCPHRDPCHRHRRSALQPQPRGCPRLRGGPHPGLCHEGALEIAEHVHRSVLTDSARLETVEVKLGTSSERCRN